MLYTVCMRHSGAVSRKNKMHFLMLYLTYNILLSIICVYTYNNIKYIYIVRRRTLKS